MLRFCAFLIAREQSDVPLVERAYRIEHTARVGRERAERVLARLADAARALNTASAPTHSFPHLLMIHTHTHGRYSYHYSLSYA